MRIGIEIPLNPDMPEAELTPSPVAGDDESDISLGLFQRVEIEALQKWAKVTKFMMGGFVFFYWLKSQKLQQTFVFSS